jgi:hypothetical protein
MSYEVAVCTFSLRDKSLSIRRVLVSDAKLMTCKNIYNVFSVAGLNCGENMGDREFLKCSQYCD